jgi:hypothetical protein
MGVLDIIKMMVVVVVMDLDKIGYEVVDWIHMMQERV